jgi:spore germination protein GerM
MRRFGRISTIVAVTVTATAITACGFPEQQSAAPVPEQELPVALRPDLVPSSTTPSETERATIWLIDQSRLVPVRHDVAAPASVESVTAALLAAPSADEQQRGLRSAMPDPTVVVGSQLARGLATVELAPEFAEISPEDQLLAVGQFVLSMTGLPGVGGVVFTIDGVPVAVPVPTGESTEGPVFRDQFGELIGPAPAS